MKFIFQNDLSKYNRATLNCKNYSFNKYSLILFSYFNICKQIFLTPVTLEKHIRPLHHLLWLFYFFWSIKSVRGDQLQAILLLIHCIKSVLYMSRWNTFDMKLFPVDWLLLTLACRAKQFNSARNMQRLLIHL